MWQVIRGNTTVRDIPVYDQKGVLVTDLENAESIHFHVCKHRQCSGIIQKNKDNGIEVNIPKTGYLRITLLPADTKIPPLKYYVALQVKWSATRIYETVIKVNGVVTDRLEIVGELIGDE
ncbi:MAG: hypothetical protein KAR42_16835 [candidate division Zixibacteria bacterium]|nr:hypothetical protein [candidate division Zixibacteria bacterium]